MRCDGCLRHAPRLDCKVSWAGARVRTSPAIAVNPTPRNPHVELKPARPSWWAAHASHTPFMRQPLTTWFFSPLPRTSSRACSNGRKVLPGLLNSTNIVSVVEQPSFWAQSITRYFREASNAFGTASYRSLGLARDQAETVS
jgi:hypothetical protein